ncbi:unnamed protein product, partial [Nesidiocoris tenuis]
MEWDDITYVQLVASSVGIFSTGAGVSPYSSSGRRTDSLGCNPAHGLCAFTSRTKDWLQFSGSGRIDSKVVHDLKLINVLEPIFELAIPNMAFQVWYVKNTAPTVRYSRVIRRIGMSHGIRAVIKSSRIKQSLPTTRILPFEYKIHFVFCALHLRFLNYQIDLRQATRRNRKRFSPI